MIRRARLFLAFAWLGLSDWFGSPWRVVLQILTPVLFVAMLIPFTLAPELPRPQARIAIVDSAPESKEIRDRLRQADYVRAGRPRTAADAEEVFEKSAADAVLTPLPQERQPGGPLPVELKVRDGGYFFWPLLANLLERPRDPAAERNIRLAPEREDRDGTPPGPVGTFLALVAALGTGGLIYQVINDRLGGWPGFLRITPVTTGFAVTALAFGRLAVMLGSWVYLIWLVDLMVGLPEGLSWTRLIMALGLSTLLFLALGTALGLLLPAYRGAGEMAANVVTPILMMGSPMFWNIGAVEALNPIVWANPVTPTLDAFLAALGAETTTMAGSTAMLMLAGWTLVLAGLLVVLARRETREEGRA